MSDARIRELERAYRESGSAEEGAAWLRERLRARDVTRDRLKLAAYLGELACGVVLAGDAPQPARTFRGWTTGLGDWGPEVSMRATIAAARRALGAVVPFFRVGDLDHPVPVLEAAEASVACPCRRHVSELLEAARVADTAARGPRAVQLPSTAAAAWQACYAAVPHLLPGGHRFPDRQAWWGPEHARLAAGEEVVAEQHLAEEPAGVADSLLGEAGERIRSAIREELIPWALGTGDPVRERVAKRGVIELRSHDLEI